MKKEFSLYDFAGIITPGITLIYFTNYILKDAFNLHFFDIDNIGESVFIFVIAYALGHIIHSIGNLLEQIVWKFFGGMPTSWLTNSTFWNHKLFDEYDKNKIIKFLYSEFGENPKKDYGKNVYNLLYLKGHTERIDIFSNNYSLFRGLAVSILIISLLIFTSYEKWYYGFIPLALCILTLYRMVRFAKLYAVEVFRTYMNYSNNK